jgi:hypothetical protein
MSRNPDRVSLIQQVREFAIQKKKSTISVIITSVILATVGVVQIIDNIQSLTAEPKDSNVSNNVSPDQALAITDLVNSSKNLDANCSFTKFNTRTPQGGYEEITQAKWLAEKPVKDAEFDFKCVNKDVQVNLTISNLIFSKPGHIKVDGIVEWGDVSRVNIQVTTLTASEDYCSYGTFDMPTVTSSGFTRFELEKKVNDPADNDCLLAAPNSFTATNSTAMSIAKSEQTARKIDNLMVSNAPQGCTYIGATIPDSYELGPLEDKTLADYLNANYMSRDWFGVSSASEDQYHFDKSLGYKIGFQPEWIYVCRNNSIEYAEFNLGGYVYDNGTLTRPTNSRLEAYFNPWIKQRAVANAIVALYDSNLNPCGDYSLSLTTEGESGNWQSISADLMLTPAVDTVTCNIVVLKSFTMKKL